MELRTKKKVAVIGAGIAIAGIITVYSSSDFISFYRENNCHSQSGFVDGYKAIISIRENGNKVEQLSKFYESCAHNEDSREALSEILSDKKSSFELFEITKEPSLEKVALASAIDRFIKHDQISLINDDLTMDLLADVFYKSTKRERIVELLANDSQDPESSPFYWMLARLKSNLESDELYKHADEILKLRVLVNFLGHDSSTLTEALSLAGVQPKKLEQLDGDIKKTPEYSRKSFLIGRTYEQPYYDKESNRYLKKYEGYINTALTLVLTKDYKTITQPGFYTFYVAQIDTLIYNDQYGYAKEAPVYLVADSEDIARRTNLMREKEKIISEEKNLQIEIIELIDYLQKSLTETVSLEDQKCFLENIKARSALRAAYFKSKGMSDSMVADKVIRIIGEEEREVIKESDGYLPSINSGIQDAIENPGKYSGYDWSNTQSLLVDCLAKKSL